MSENKEKQKERKGLHEKIEELKSSVNTLESSIKTITVDTQKQKDLYEQNKSDYGSIINYRKEIFGEGDKVGIKKEVDDILTQAKNLEEKMNAFDEYWDGTDGDLSFTDCKQKIDDVVKKADQLKLDIENYNTSCNNFKKTFEDKLKEIEQSYIEMIKKNSGDVEKLKNELGNKIVEIEAVKASLEDYRNQVVGASLFKSYEDRMQKNDKISEGYSKWSIGCLLGAAGVMTILLATSLLCKPQTINYILPSSISIILFTASFVCSSKSKIYHKSAEEYAHKATLLKSFVGYKDQYKQTLDDEEYNQFFREVISAVKINASERIDKLLHFKWPWERAVEATNNMIEKAKDTAVNLSKNSLKVSDEIKD